MIFKTIKNVSKHVQVKDAIAKRIADGGLRPGEQLPPERKLMQSFGVSYSTMSRALSELMRAGLVERKWGQGTFVRDAKPLATNVAVMLGDTYSATHPYIDRLLKGITRAARGVDWHIQIFPLHDGMVYGGSDETLLARMVRERLVCGVIGCGPQPPDDLRQLAEAGVAVVTVNTAYPETSVPSVMSHGADAAQRIVDHLVALGHRRIGMIMGPEPQADGRVLRASALFFDAAVGAMAAHGLPLPPDLIVRTDYRWGTCRDTVRALLSGPNRPTAIMSIDDILALETVRLAATLNLRVPEDLSVVSSGDILPETTLTSFTMPLEEMGARAVSMLHSILEGTPQKTCHLKGTLTVRKTCGPAPGQAEDSAPGGQHS